MGWNGEGEFADAIHREKLAEPIQVFSFEVEDFHTYFVGAGCVLVHNDCGNHGKLWDRERRKYWREQGKLYKNSMDSSAYSASVKYKLAKENISRMLRGSAPRRQMDYQSRYTIIKEY